MREIIEVESVRKTLNVLPIYQEDYCINEFEKWVYSAETLTRFLTNDDTRLLVLMKYLDCNILREVYDSGIYNWADVRSMLEARALSITEGRVQLEPLWILDVRQQCGETLEHYMARFLVSGKCCSKIPGFPEQLLIDSFLDGLLENSVARKFLEESPSPDTFQEITRSLSHFFSEGGETHLETAQKSFLLAKKQFLTQYTKIMGAIRAANSVEDYKRYFHITDPELSEQEILMSLDKPEPCSTWVNQRVMLELEPFFGKRMLAKLAKPIASINIPLPRLGRIIDKMCGGQPIITPGYWLSKTGIC